MALKVKEMVIKDKLTDQVLCLKALSQKTFQYEDMTVHSAVLSDKTGEIRAYLSDERYGAEMQDYVGGAVCVNGVVLNGKNMEPLLKIKSLALAEAASFSPSEIFDGLDEAHVNGYIRVIKEAISQITDDELKGFVDACFTDDVFRELASKPASLRYHGTYRGGALACAGSVVKMACQAGLQYKKWSCGLYKPTFDWSMLLAASCLCTYGVLGYYTGQPCRKTPSGVQRGYMSVLQSSLQKVVMSGNSLSYEKFDKLLNILASSVPMKSGVKATSSEGMVLRHVLMLYEELDMFDASVAGHEPEDGETYFFDHKARRTIPIDVPDTSEGGVA